MARDTTPLDLTPHGFAADRWQTAREHAPVLELDDLGPPGAGLIVIAAHPDDETLGAGRLIAAWTRRRAEVGVISLTDGEACFDGISQPIPSGRDSLASRRRREWRAALQELGVTRSAAPGMPDSRLETREDDALSVASEILRDWSMPGPYVVASPWSEDPHPDHQAAGRVAERLAAALGAPHLAFPIWTTYWTQPRALEEKGHRLASVRTSPVDEAARARALNCYRSQITSPAPGVGPVVPEEMLAHHDRQLLVIAQ